MEDTTQDEVEAALKKWRNPAPPSEEDRRKEEAAAALMLELGEE